MIANEGDGNSERWAHQENSRSIQGYGRVSGGVGARVNAYRGCEVLRDVQYCGLYSVSQAMQPGDSGGPWLRGQTAVAITTAGSSTNTLITPTSYVGLISGSPSIRR